MAAVPLSERHEDELDLSRLAWQALAPEDTVEQSTEFLGAVINAKVAFAVELYSKGTPGHDAAGRDCLIEACLFLRDTLGDLDVRRALAAGIVYSKIAAGRTV